MLFLFIRVPVLTKYTQRGILYSYCTILTDRVKRQTAKTHLKLNFPISKGMKLNFHTQRKNMVNNFNNPEELGGGGYNIIILHTLSINYYCDHKKSEKLGGSCIVFSGGVNFILERISFQLLSTMDLSHRNFGLTW